MSPAKIIVNDCLQKSNCQYGTDDTEPLSKEEELLLGKHLREVWNADAQENQHSLKPMADFLVSCTALPQLVMWGFLAWYMLVVALCWSSLQSKPFLDACVIMLLVGFVLNANAFVSFQHHIWDCPNSRFDPTLAVYMRRQATSAVRLFVIPYCVSCYSGIANSTPGFFSIFPVKISVLIPVAIGAVAFPLCLRLASDMTSRAVYPKESNVERNRRRSTTMVAVRF